jgi:hypothetical protein
MSKEAIRVKGPVILRARQLNECHILFTAFFEKFETRSTKLGTRTKCGESEP